MDDDYDFFDSPKGPPPHVGNLKLSLEDEKQDKSSQRNGAPKSSKSKTHDKRYSDSEYSSDDSYESHGSKPKKTIEAKLPQMKADNSESDSEYSDSGRRAPTPDKKDRQKRYSQSSSASGSDQGKYRDGSETGQAVSKLKPKRSMMGRKRSDSYSSDESYNSLTESETDSDVTDVSPLNTPHTPLVDTRPRVDFREDNLSDRARQSKPPVSPNKEARSSRSRPVSASSTKSGQPSSRVEQLLSANNDSVDMKLLLEAVMEMERERGDYDQRSRTSSTRSKPKIYKPQGPAPQPKKNFSFSNENVRSIDLENQRLMQKIMRLASEGKKKKREEKQKVKKASPQKAIPFTSSSLNRQREQMRIEQENQAFLRRLQGTGATRAVQRDNLLKDYSKATLYGYSVAAAHDSPPKKSHKSPYDAPESPMSAGFGNTFSRSNSSMKETESLSGQRSRPQSGKRSRPQSGQRSRPTSATTRPGSASLSPAKSYIPQFKPPGQPKAAWEDKW